MPLQIIDGFKVTVCDFPLANYGRWNGLAIFDEYSYVEAQNLIREYGNLFQQKDELSSNAVEDNKRNSYFFGLLKSAILFAKKYLYDRGGYLSGKFMGQEITSLYTFLGVKNDFLKDIFCLDNLPEMTEIVDDGNNLVLLTNEPPNSPC